MLSTTPYKYINASGKQEEVYSPSNPQNIVTATIHTIVDLGSSQYGGILKLNFRFILDTNETPFKDLVKILTSLELKNNVPTVTVLQSICNAFLNKTKESFLKGYGQELPIYDSWYISPDNNVHQIIAFTYATTTSLTTNAFYYITSALQSYITATHTVQFNNAVSYVIKYFKYTLTLRYN